MSIKRNNIIKQHILDPANCHCTYREFTSETSAVAKCSISHKERATISWRHKQKESVISWRLPIGVAFSKKVRHDATDEEIDEVITVGFAQMDEAWQTGEQ